MLSVIQLVTQAQIDINNEKTIGINRGIVALIGIEKSDTLQSAEKLVERIINYRIFADKEGRMNLSLRDINGELLIVPQFTLVADTSKGTRPGFSIGMPPEEGRVLFEQMVRATKQKYEKVESGIFGANMLVNLSNDGPATFILHVK